MGRNQIYYFTLIYILFLEMEEETDCIDQEEFWCVAC
jgi:hypothetical protein